MTTTNSFITMSIEGANPSNESTTLYTNGVGIQNKVIYLNIEGYTDSTNSYIPLYLEVDNLPGDDSLYLYIQNDETEVSIYDTLTIYMNGVALTDSGTIPLYLENEQIGESVPLYIYGEGFWAGFVSTNDSVPLFINRPDESTSISLFCKTVDDTTNSYIPLHITSTVESNSNVSLVIPNVKIDTNSFVPLNITGVIDSSSNITMFEEGHAETNDTVTLYLEQGSGSTNSYTTLYVSGANVKSDSITLVIPNVVDDDTTGTVDLYIFGW